MFMEAVSQHQRMILYHASTEVLFVYHVDGVRGCLFKTSQKACSLGSTWLPENVIISNFHTQMASQEELSG